MGDVDPSQPSEFGTLSPVLEPLAVLGRRMKPSPRSNPYTSEAGDADIRIAMAVGNAEGIARSRSSHNRVEALTTPIRQRVIRHSMQGIGE